MLRPLRWFLAWLFAVLMFVLLRGVVTLVRSSYDWKLWPAIQRAKRNIKKSVRRRVPSAEVWCKQGATRIRPGYLSFLIKTNTDQDRDLLRQDPQIITDFRYALAEAGYPAATDRLPYLSIQSQETVDREYGGRWYDVLDEMP